MQTCRELGFTLSPENAFVRILQGEAEIERG